MFGMGMTLQFNEIKSVLRKPAWISVTILLQFTIMPFLAFIICSVLKFSEEITLGFIILGACPGGTASNVICYICKANVSLSILCTFVSTLLAVIFTPLIILLFANVDINVDLLSLIKSTFLIILLPVLTGFIIKMLFISKNQKYTKSFPLISELMIALIIGIIFAVNYDNLENISYSLVLGIILHNIIGLCIALLISYLLKYPDDVRKTISIEVAMQNSGLGMTLAFIHFSKIVALPSALFSIWHNISAAGLVYLWKKK